MPVSYGGKPSYANWLIKERPRSLLQDKENHLRWWMSLGTLNNFCCLSGGEPEQSALGVLWH